MGNFSADLSKVSGLRVNGPIAKQRKCGVTSQEIETKQTGISVVIETSDALIRQANREVV